MADDEVGAVSSRLIAGPVDRAVVDDDRLEPAVARELVEDTTDLPRLVKRRDDDGRQAQTERSAQHGNQAGLRQDKRKDLRAGEAQSLEHSQLTGPLAHCLGHGISSHQQNREKDRSQDRCAH